MAKIKKEITDRLKKDWVTQGKIISAVNKHPRTIENWIIERSEMLTTHTVLEILKSSYKLPESKLLESNKLQTV